MFSLNTTSSFSSHPEANPTSATFGRSLFNALFQNSGTCVYSYLDAAH
jgi:hypothetical protein